MDRLNVLCFILVSCHLYVRTEAENHRDCDIYKDCVECKAFSTGAFGVMDCLHHCDIASYIPSDGEDFDLELKNFSLCRYRNNDKCYFSFRIGREKDFGPDLFINQELDCPTYEPTYPSVVAIDVTTEPTTSTSTKMTTKPAVKKVDKEENDNGNVQSDSAIIEDTQPVAGSEKDSNLISDKEQRNPNSASVSYQSLVNLTLCFFLLMSKHL